MDNFQTHEESSCSNSNPGGGETEKVHGAREVDEESIFQNLLIAHEIAMTSNTNNGEIKIQDFVEKNEFWSLVKNQVHSAFWEIFRQEISQDPPVLTMAFLLIKDIKESLFAVMTPNLAKLKANVEEVLDIELIKQQAEHGAISLSDVKKYAEYVISVMSKICAPVRDTEMVKLSNETDVVAIFRGILETLSLMKVDLINFTLKVVTPEILGNQMEYERKKFLDYLNILGGKMPITENWLKKHKSSRGNVQNEILYAAFLEILSSNSVELPETLFMDAPRLSLLKRQYYELVLASSIVIITLNSMPPELSTDASYKQALKANVSILLHGINTDETLDKMIPNLIEQTKQDSNKFLAEKGKEKLNDFVANALEQQIKDVASPENKIRSLVSKRVQDFLESSLNLPSSNGPFPPALVLFQRELEELNAKFKRVVHHNITVCGSYYSKIILESE